ncbi:MAG: hypothetical protein H6766_05520 [Candidatus Peribacteria bacterium]|nr:MAG: hypothetical protein H6766_05520 [Candidatus Peribacteria bacterium]
MVSKACQTPYHVTDNASSMAVMIRHDCHHGITMLITSTISNASKRYNITVIKSHDIQYAMVARVVI